MINAGKYNKRISIIKVKECEDYDGFNVKKTELVLSTFAEVKTTRGFTLIASNTDFEKSYTNFIIRFPKVDVTRDMLVRYKDKEYTIEYLNNIDEKNVELEIQAKLVDK